MKKILLVITLFIPNIVMAASFDVGETTVCGMSNLPATLPDFTSTIFSMIKVLIPVILIILGMIDMFSAMAASNQDKTQKAQKKLITRVIAALIIFFIFSIVQFVFNTVGTSDNGQISDCLNCLINNNNCGSSNVKRVDVKRKGKYCEEYSKDECPSTDSYGYKCVVKDSVCKGKCEEYSTESPCTTHKSCKWDIYHCIYDDSYVYTPSSSTDSSTNDTKKTVLLIGNSKTIGTSSSGYNNSVQTKLSGFLKADNNNYDVKKIAVASKNLKYLYNNYKNELTSNKFDYVIMQEHTTELFELDTYKKYVNLISNAVKKKNSNVKIYVRAVWAYKDKNKVNRKYTTAKSNTEAAANKIGASVIYDGKALYAAGNINVFESDGKHQNQSGAYIAAGCIYKAITGKSVSNSSYTSGLSNYKQLQKIANNNC